MERGVRQRALITGASSGIGRSLARVFAAHGYDLVLVARREALLRTVAADLQAATQASIDILAGDLATADGALRVYDELRTRNVHIDVLVNNAGFGLQGSFAELPLDRQLEMIELNVTALTSLSRLLLPGMLARNRGGILNVASTAAFQPGPGMAVYYASKAYVLSFTEALVEEVAGTAVRISCLAPGPTHTGFAAAAGMTGSRLFRMGAMSADRVARLGFAGWRGGKPIVVPGARNRAGAFALRFAPRAVVRKLVKRLNTVTR